MTNSISNYPENFTLSKLPKGFVWLQDFFKSKIPGDEPAIHSRYATYENFIGRLVKGYYAEGKDATGNVIQFADTKIAALTVQAAEALLLVQKELLPLNLSLIIYDAYRSQTSVEDFYSWAVSDKLKDDQIAKNGYYQYIEKSKLFKLGYIARKSGHTRGSKVDVNIISRDAVDKKLFKNVVDKILTLSDGRKIIYKDDASWLMGTSFDCMDDASGTFSPLVDDKAMKNRIFLKNLMEKHGFENYVEREWWDYRFRNEAFMNKYFDFPLLQYSST